MGLEGVHLANHLGSLVSTSIKYYMHSFLVKLVSLFIEKFQEVER